MVNNAVFLLTGLLYMACSGCFITESRNTSPEMAPGECLPDGSQRGISSIVVCSFVCNLSSLYEVDTQKQPV